jgi:hypothetical protein
MQRARCAAEKIRAEAEGTATFWMSEFALMTITNIDTYSDSLRAGRLSDVSKGGGLGFSRGISEWTEGHPNCAELQSLALEIDRFYSEEMRS